MGKEERARELIDALIHSGISLAMGASKWNTEQSDKARELRDNLTAELLELIKGEN